MLGTLQRIAFAKWTRTLGFFEYNPVNGYIEMRWLAPNTLVLTNSKALYSIIQPENPEQRFNRQTFQFPSEESFKFFSNGDKKYPHHTMKQPKICLTQNRSLVFTLQKVKPYQPQ